MNRPPPVTFPVGCGPQLGCVLVGAWLLAVIPVLAALAFHAPARLHTGAWVIAWLACMAGSGLAWRFWRQQARGALVWNGVSWLLETTGGDGLAVAATVIAHPGIRFDGQRWLLLRARTGRRAVWLWGERSADPARWHALRCALCAPVSTPMSLA